MVVQRHLGDRYFGDKGVVRLIQSFLNPEHLISMPESPVPLREDAQVLSLMVTADSYICLDVCSVLW